MHINESYKRDYYQNPYYHHRNRGRWALFALLALIPIAIALYFIFRIFKRRQRTHQVVDYNQQYYQQGSNNAANYNPGYGGGYEGGYAGGPPGGPPTNSNYGPSNTYNGGNYHQYDTNRDGQTMGTYQNDTYANNNEYQQYEAPPGPPPKTYQGA